MVIKPLLTFTARNSKSKNIVETFQTFWSFVMDRSPRFWAGMAVCLGVAQDLCGQSQCCVVMCCDVLCLSFMQDHPFSLLSSVSRVTCLVVQMHNTMVK